VTTFDEMTLAFGLDAVQADALDHYLDLVLGWRRGNVTAVRTRAAAIDLLLGDSLALLDVPVLAAAGPRWLDLGAGAGVPGIPLAVACPSTELTLLDSVARKCAFLKAAVAAVGLAGRADVVCARSEAYAASGASGREAFDVVLVRAVGSLAIVVELAAPLLAVGGALLAVKTVPGAERESAAGEAAAGRCGLSAAAIVPLSRSPLHESACVVYTKLAAAPDWLPRRPGLAARRPLAP
jgi:16S rRNA (guanine527-N7)-methyltransferase